MKVVAIVPIKLNNERLPNKNIKEFDNGQPLCSFLLNTLNSVKNIDETYVYCSDELIKNYIPEGVKYLERSDALDTSKTSMTDILKAFIKEVDADIYVLSHVTSPFLKPESLYAAIEKVKTSEFDSAFSVEELHEFLWSDNEPNYDIQNIPRTQDLNPVYKETSGFYIFEKDIMKTHSRRIGFKPYLKTVSSIEGIDIDDKEDFDIANVVMNAN